MLSHSGRAAIRAVIYLSSQEISGIHEIAESIGASSHTVGKLLQKLVHEGIINSMKGPGGGFYITKSQLRQPLIKIIDAIDGKDVLQQCAVGLSACSDTNPCPLHHEYKNISRAYRKMCRSMKITDLKNKLTSGETLLLLN